MTGNQSTVENAKEKLAANLNMCLVIYTLPAVLEMNKAPANLFSKKILEAWKAHFPKTNLKRMTLRQALLNLEAESKIFRKDRKGWFVTQPRFNYSPELSASFQRAAIEQGREPSWGFTEKSRTSDIPETLAPLIAVTPSTELYRITGWGALEGHKVFYHETYINPEVAPGFIEQLENHSFSAVWEKCYQKETVVKKLIFKPVRMPGDISKYLGGSAGMPAILIEKHRADQQGNIVQIDIEYWRFEAVDLIINL